MNRPSWLSPNHLKNEKVVLLFLAGIFFIVFHYSMLPTVGFYGDTPRFQTTPAIWGLNNAPGSPLYIFLGRLFLLVPFGDVAYKMNLMSVVFGCVSLALLYILLRMFQCRPLPAFLVTGLFGFSKFFWEQSIVAELYTISLTFVLTVTLCLWLWVKYSDSRWLLAGLTFYAISFGNHLGMLLLLPAIAYWLLVEEWRLILKPRFLLFVVLVVFIGASQYLYVWWYGQTNDFYGDGLTTWSQFIFFVTGSGFKSWLEVPSVELLWDKLKFVFGFLHQQLFWWGLLLVVVGYWYALRSDKRKLVYLSLFALPNLVFAVIYQITDPEIYLLPVALCLVPFAGIGLQQIADFIKDRSPAIMNGVFYVVALTLFMIVPAYVTFPLVNLRHITVAQDWSADFVKDLEPGSLIYAGLINRWDTLAYALKVAHPEVDAELIWIADQVRVVEEKFGQQPIYVSGNDYWLTSNFVLDPPPPPHIASVLRRVPEGSIVILSVYDDASLTLDDTTIQALNQAGIVGDLRGQYRMAHLAVGVQGSAPGSAYERTGYGILFGSIKAGDEIGTTGVFSPVDISVRSASLRRGFGGQIWVDGHNRSPGVRGYNVVVLDGVNGEVLFSFSRDLAIGPDVDGLQRFRIVGRRQGDEIELADAGSVFAWSLPEGNHINFADWDARRYMGEGWGLTEDWGLWTIQPNAVLHLHVPPQNYNLKIEAMPFAVEGQQQGIRIIWNGHDLGYQPFNADGVEELGFSVPREVVTEDINEVRFEFNYAISPNNVTQGQTSDMRTLAVWFVSLKMIPE